MDPIEVRKLDKELAVRFSHESVVLPAEIQAKIDRYWNGLIASGKSYRRGEVFTVTQVVETETAMDVLVEKSDYAHYLYCQNIDTLGEHGIRVIHTACLVFTSDHKAILGKMASWTARAGMYQLCGGGIDLNDLKGDVFDLEHNIVLELEEELGIDTTDKERVESFDIKHIKTGGATGKMSVVYEAVLHETEAQFLESYNHFEQELKNRGEEPEFGEIVTLSLKNEKIVQEFFDQNRDKCDEYIEPLFEFVLKARA